MLASVAGPTGRAGDLAGKLSRQGRRRLQRAAGGLRDRHLLPGVDAPTTFCSIAHWVDGEAEGAQTQMLGDEKPSTAGGGRTIGQVCDVFSPAHAKPSKPLWLLSLRQGRLATPSGVAITADGQVVTETAWDLEQLRLSLPAASRLRTPAHLTGTHASLISLWSENFFHWMLDALPRYAVLERSGLAGEATLIVPERLNGFQTASLAQLGISLERTSPYRRQHVQADTLLVPSPAAHTGNPSPWVVSWLRNRLGPKQVEKAGRRLYISRAAAKTRRVVNERPLWQLLRRRGFEWVSPEAMQLAEQIRLFAESSVVIGPHGAAHVNTLFSPRLSLVELFAPVYLNRCNLALADAAGHDYWYVIGRDAGNGNLEAPLDVVEATLDAILA